MRKTGISLIVCALAMLAIVGVVLAAGTLPASPGKVSITIQNVKAIAPAPGASRCDTVTGTRAVFKTYTSSGYLQVDATTFNSDTGAPVAVKWLEDGKQVWVGSSYSGVNDRAKAFATLGYQDYSSATHSTGSCVRRQ